MKFLLITILYTAHVVQSSRDCQAVPQCRCSYNFDNELTASCDVSDIATTVQSLPELVSDLKIVCFNQNSQRISSQTFQRFKNMTSLSLKGCQFINFKLSVFQELELSSLIVRFSNLQSTVLAFNSSYLKSLELSGSGIMFFPDINGLKNLQYLNVSSNNLVDYGGFEFSCDYVNNTLLHVDLSDNRFNKLPYLSKCYSHLKTFKMANNLPVKLSDNYLQSLKFLEVLDLDGTTLEGIVSSLDNLTNLTYLKLQGVGQLFNSSVDNFAHLKELHLRNFHTRTDFLDGVSFLSDLISLKIVACNISFVPKYTFQNLTLLETIDFFGNQIEHISPGTFDNLVNLSLLSLSHNKLKRVQARTLTVTNLKMVDLSVNEIEFISSESFDNLTQITRLNISDNRLSYLSANIFQKLSIVEDLFLNKNDLKSLPSFVSLGNLKHLDLKDNQLKGLNENSFLGLKSLLGISVRNNSIPSLPSTIFRNSPLLTYLDAAYNYIQIITKHPLFPTPWGNLSDLNFLRLDFNRIRYLTEHLATFKKLQYLFLDNNKLTKITAGMFPRSIVNLELSHNQITAIGQLLPGLPNLASLSLQFNIPLRRIDMTSFWLVSKYKPKVFLGFNVFKCDCNLLWLKTLTIPGQEILKPLRNLPTFPDLNFTYCVNPGSELVKLISYPIEKFTCVYENDELECLLNCNCCIHGHTDGCPCAYLCPKGCLCKKARRLFHKNEVICDNRNMTTIPKSLPPDATDINLSGNNILQINNDSFSTLSDLQHLYLNKSVVKSLHVDSFNGMEQLTTLHLENNELCAIPSEIFKNLVSLRELYLHNNLIINILPDSFYGLSMLQTLTLNNNMLHDITSLAPIDNLMFVKVALRNNQWSCDCNFMDAFIDFVTANARRITDVEALHCVWTADTEVIHNQNENGNMLFENETRVLDFDYQVLCSNKTIVVNATSVKEMFVDDNRFLGTIIGLTFLSLALFVFGFVIVWKRRFVQVVIYNKLGIRFVPEVLHKDQDFKYDAFVSFTYDDLQFVIRELMPRLETEKNFKLCLHFRDFPAGESIAENIVAAVDSSQKTILVISNSFLMSEWCKFEFQTAHHVMLTERANSIVIILKENVKDELLDPDLRVHLKTKTYVKYGDPWFWEKLYFALPELNRKNKLKADLEEVDGQIEIINI